MNEFLKGVLIFIVMLSAVSSAAQNHFGNALIPDMVADASILIPHLQWNYQPREDYYSLSERPGWLRLKAFCPLERCNLMKAGNTLTQRVVRGKGESVVKIDISGMAEGQIAGLCHFSKEYAALGVRQKGDRRRLEFISDDKAPIPGPSLTGDVVWIKSEWDSEGRSRFSYSSDGVCFIPAGPDYQLSWGNYRGDRTGVFCFNDDSDSGFVDIDFFENFNF